MVTSSHGAPARACSQLTRMCSSSRSRPTKRVSCERSGTGSTETSRYAATGSALPFNVEWIDRLRLDGGANELHRRPADKDVTGLCRLLEAGGGVDRVAGSEALLGAGHDLAGVDADPGLYAERGERSRISTAARQARSASSSCAAGTPNTAITASPMNFSTVPPCDSTIAFIRSK